MNRCPAASIVTLPTEQKRLLLERMTLAVERLLEAMDALDGDPDLEIDADLEEEPDREPEESGLVPLQAGIDYDPPQLMQNAPAWILRTAAS